jgi:aerobic carbon-monoxide dehydrogenase large subunit
MEPDCCAAAPGDDGRTHRLGVTQMPHMLQGQLATPSAWTRSMLRVVTPHVGGGFGARPACTHEYTVTAAMHAPAGRPVVWVPSRSDDMKALPTAAARCSTPSSAAPATALHRSAGAPRRRRRRLPGHRRVPARRHPADVAGHVRLPGDPVRRRGRRHEHHADGRLPRGRASRGHRAPRTPRRPGRARARHRPDRAARAQPPPRRRVPVPQLTGATYDSGRYRPAAAHRGRGDRLRRAARRAGRARASAATTTCSASGSPRTSRSPPAAAPASSAPSRCIRRFGHGHVRHPRPRAGPPDRLRHARVADQTGIPVDRIRLVDGDTDRVRSGGGTGGSRSLQLGGTAVHRGHRGDGRQGDASWRHTCWRPTRPTSWSTGPRHVGVAACQPAR